MGPAQNRKFPNQRQMPFVFKWRPGRADPSPASVEVSERDGVRTLHLGSDSVQSAMRLADPWALELEYTRCMMGFLLFPPEPRDVLMIGLGGGSLAKFIHRHLPATRTVAMEINPQAAAAARSLFFLPPDDERLRVEIAEGSAFVARHPESADVLLVDGYDGRTLAPELAREAFFADAAAALRGNGILVVNLWSSDSHFNRYAGWMEAHFPGGVLFLPAQRKGNIVVLAFLTPQGQPRWESLEKRAAELQARLGLEFPAFVEMLRRHNAGNKKRLLI